MNTAKRLFVANWKEHKTYSQGGRDFRKLWKTWRASPSPGKEIVLCPPSPFLSLFRAELGPISPDDTFKLGAQDVSHFEEGSYTGEVSARLLSGLVSYVLVGHSERRRFLGETRETVQAKILLCQKNDLIPIVCVSDASEVAGLESITGFFYLAYEPLMAVGSGQAAPVVEVSQFYKRLPAKIKGQTRLLYGGSFNEADAEPFLSLPFLAGFLIGTASLDPPVFLRLVGSS